METKITIPKWSATSFMLIRQLELDVISYILWWNSVCYNATFKITCIWMWTYIHWSQVQLASEQYVIVLLEWVTLPLYQIFKLFSLHSIVDLKYATDTTNNNYVICGGINTNLLKCHLHTHITNRVNSTLGFGCISVTNDHTRFCSTSQLSFPNQICNNVYGGQTLPLFQTSQKTYRPNIRCLKFFQLSSFLEDVDTDYNSYNFSNSNSGNNTTCETFFSMIKNILEQHASRRFVPKEAVFWTIRG